MSDEEKKKTLIELYRNFRMDLDHLDRERLAFMRRVVKNIETEQTKKVLASLRE